MWRRLSSAALVATAAVLPFELRATLPAGPLRLSSVELVLYATLGLWAISRVAAARGSWRKLLDFGDFRRWPPPLVAAAGLAVVLLLSAACAPQFRGPAVKFALRTCGGIVLGVAAADLLRDPPTLRRTLVALVAGMLVAAVAAIAETRLPSIAPLLRPFHDQTFQALGQVRGSGPLQFPNIAAMALEAAVPLALALPSRHKAAAAICAALLLAGVVSTGSRAAVVGAAVAALALAVYWRAEGASRRAGRIAVTIAAVLLVSVFAATGSLSSRLTFWNETRWYRARIAPAGGPADRLPARLPLGGVASEVLTVTNEGQLGWRRSPPFPVVLSHHWLDAGTGRVVVRDGLPTALPVDVAPGDSVTVRAAVHTPAAPGRYVLWWDMLQQDVSWFSARADGGWRELLVVGDGSAPGSGAGPIEQFGLPAERASRAELWRAALAAFRDRPLLGVGPDNFRRLYGGYLPPSAAGRAADDRLHANSLYFETLADLGLVGLAAAAALIVALAAAARRAIASAGLVAAGVAVALGTFLLHGTLDYFFEFTPTYSMFWLLAGALVALDPLTPEIDS